MDLQKRDYAKKTDKFEKGFISTVKAIGALGFALLMFSFMYVLGRGGF